MAMLPGVLGRRPLRRTDQVRLGASTLWLPGTRRKRLRCAWHAHLRGLATVVHEISGLSFSVIPMKNLHKFELEHFKDSIT